MNTRDRLRIIAVLAALTCADFVTAQQSMQSMPGMDMPAPTSKPIAPRKAHEKPKLKSPDLSMHEMQSMPAMSMPAPALAKGKQENVPANDHLPPAAPALAMPSMSATRMTDVMQMDDQATRGMWLMDRLERTRGTNGDMATTWETDAWWGSDIDKLWLRSEGEKTEHGTRDARAELLWDHAFATFWDWRIGARDDFGSGPGRQWLAAGVRGLAPYWFDLGATLYAGPQGRTAARLEASYDLRVTRRLVLTPDLELNLYGRNDPRRDVHAGLSDAELGLRLRYEISRRFAPYIGANWTYRHGGSPLRPAPIEPAPTHELTWLLGVRFWL